MDNYCLKRHEIKNLIDNKIENKEIDGDDLKEIFNRALYWDMNIISCNILFSIALEQKSKLNIVHESIIDSYYSLPDGMSFLIEEFNADFVDYIYNNKMPTRRNLTVSKLEDAKRNNNTTLYDSLIAERDSSFEEDIISIIEDYYGKIYR
jgi:hypothetical protein